MPTARGACTTWYDSYDSHEADDDDDVDSYYEDDYDDDDDDTRFNQWKRDGYMLTPNVFYSWQERVQPHSPDPLMQMYIEPRNP